MIILVFALTTFILYRVSEQRTSILTRYEEGLFITTRTSELAKLRKSYTDTPINVKSVTSTSYPIKEYVVKSAYNCARSGYYIGTDCIEWVLSRGCRFLDFEVYAIDNAPYVAYSTDSTYTTMTSSSEILLADALRCVVNNGFAGVAPNPTDPLFIQLRVRTNDKNLYNLIGMTVANTLGERLYEDKVTMDTDFSSLKGHVILVYDKSQEPSYMDIANYPRCEDKYDDGESCFRLTKFINVESGTDILRTYSNSIMFGQLFTPVTINGYGTGTTTVSNWRIVTPDDADSATNMNAISIMERFSAQFILQKYYICDSQIKTYEKFFSDHGTSFVPLSSVISYIQQSDLS